MKVSINNPCHENWDAMTPNEQGAFCLSCQKNVVDFSTKTTQEIKSFFQSVADTEKVCGRFKKEQLTELSFDDFFQRFRNWILPKKVAVIMFFVFGLSLFSCQTTKQEPLMGDVAFYDTTEHPEVTGKVAYVEGVNEIDGDTIRIKKTQNPEQTEIVKMGEVSIVEPVPTTTVVPKQQPSDVKFRTVEEVYLKGDVAFDSDTIKKPKCTKDTIPEKMIKGKVKVGD